MTAGPKLIAFTGLAGTGKDTAGKILVREFGFRRYSFAWPIKRALNAMFGWNMNQWEDRQWKEAVHPLIGKSPRVLAQTLGTEWGRELVSQDVWVQAASIAWNTVCAFHTTAPGLTEGMAICDLRFENEATWVRSQGGTIVHLGRLAAVPVSGHVSEAGVKPHYDSDKFIDNNGTIEDLQIALSSIVRNMQ